MDINSKIKRGRDVQELRQLKLYTDLKTIRGRQIDRQIDRERERERERERIDRDTERELD